MRRLTIRIWIIAYMCFIHLIHLITLGYRCLHLVNEENEGQRNGAICSRSHHYIVVKEIKAKASSNNPIAMLAFLHSIFTTQIYYDYISLAMSSVWSILQKSGDRSESQSILS